MADLKKYIAVLLNIVLTTCMNFGSIKLAQAQVNPVDIAQVETARGHVANRLHLMGADLLDSLVFEWNQTPIFDNPTRFVLVGITVPMGTNARLASFLENHFYQLLLDNPSTQLIPIHCAVCRAIKVKSNSKQTIIGRHIDINSAEVYESLPNAQYFLFLDFEVAGSQLVLKARMTRKTVQPDASIQMDRIIFARSIATDSSTPPLLRDSRNIVSIHAARQQYIDILQQKSDFRIPLRIRTAILPTPETSQEEVVMPPMIWFEGGAEISPDVYKRWLAEVTIGVSSIPEQYDGFSLGAKVSRIFSSQSPSLYKPEIYGYFSAGYMELTGSAAIAFREDDRLTFVEMDQKLKKEEKIEKAAFTFLRFGVEVLVKSTYRLGGFMEAYPAEMENENLGKVGQFHAYGFEFGVTI